MDAFAKYLRQVSEELNVLQGDIIRIVIDKEKQKKEEEIKQKEEKENPKKENANAKKKTAQEQFKDISLKSLQSVTKFYKNEKEIDEAQKNPEIDFITKKIEDIFKG